MLFNRLGAVAEFGVDHAELARGVGGFLSLGVGGFHCCKVLLPRGREVLTAVGDLRDQHLEPLRLLLGGFLPVEQFFLFGLVSSPLRIERLLGIVLLLFGGLHLGGGGFLGLRGLGARLGRSGLRVLRLPDRGLDGLVLRAHLAPQPSDQFGV